jgi:hypothetical protein
VRRWISRIETAAAIAILVIFASPIRDIALIGMSLIVEDAAPGHGGAVIQLRNHHGEDARLISLTVDGIEQLAPAPNDRGWLLRADSPAADRFVKIVSAPAGLRRGSIVFDLSSGAGPLSFDFDIEIVARQQCDLQLRLEPAESLADKCANHRPASYGGLSRH